MRLSYLLSFRVKKAPFCTGSGWFADVERKVEVQGVGCANCYGRLLQLPATRRKIEMVAHRTCNMIVACSSSFDERLHIPSFLGPGGRCGTRKRTPRGGLWEPRLH